MKIINKKNEIYIRKIVISYIKNCELNIDSIWDDFDLTQINDPNFYKKICKEFSILFSEKEKKNILNFETLISVIKRKLYMVQYDG